MPRGDRTGPMGQGPMTGRAAGYCAGYGVPGYANPIPGGFGRGYGYGRGFGFGRGYGGGGWGWRNRFYATGVPGWAAVPSAVPIPPPPSISAQQELDMLKQQAEYFGSALDDIKRRIDELESKES